jgi:hypothetical protein
MTSRVVTALAAADAGRNAKWFDFERSPACACFGQNDSIKAKSPPYRFAIRTGQPLQAKIENLF